MRDLRQMQLTLGLSLFVALVCSALPARAQETQVERVTDRGRLLIGGGLGAYGSNDDADVPWPHLAEWSAHADPSVAYFVRDRVGLGLTVGGLLGRERFDRGAYELSLRQHQASVGVLGVFELPLGARVGLIALPRLAYVRVWRNWKLSWRERIQAAGRGLQEQTILAGEPSSFDAHVLRAALFLPFVFHASEAVALGFGPELWYDHVLGRDPDTDWSSFGRDISGFYLGASSWIGIAF